jgi:hypothetical protein
MAINTGEPRRIRRASRRETERQSEDNSADSFPGTRQPVRGTPANENEPGNAALISNLKRRPSSTPFWVAFLVSLAWIFACAAIYGPSIFNEANLFGSAGLPKLMTAAIALLLPIGLAWTAAYLLYRAQQLRQVSEALMHTALRLVRPQDIAAESLSSVAQTIREEINLLVSGVEQAVQRAGQLEEMVHKEMASIERAFGGNEERIRNLVSGLESQRQALQQAGFIIGAEATPLLTRLEDNTHHLDGIISSAQGTLAALEHGLKETTEELARTIDDVAARAAMVGDQIGSQTARMEHMSGFLLNEVQGFSEHITTQVEVLSQSAGQLNTEGTTFGQTVKSMEASVLQTLRQSVAELTGLHSEVQRSVDRMTSTLAEQLQTTSQQFTELLQGTSDNITYHLKTTTAEVNQQLERSGVEVSQQIQVSGDDLTQRVLTTSSEFIQNVARARSELFSYLEESSGAMTTRLEDTTNQLFGKIEQVSSSMTDQLVTATQRVTERLDEASSELTGRLDETATRLFDNVDRSNSGIFARLDATSSEVSQKLDHAGNSMFIRIDTTARNLGERFDIATELLQRVTTDITGRMEGTSAAFAEVLDKASDALTSKIAGTRSEFSNLINQVSTGLLSELGKASSVFADGLSTGAGAITGRFEQTTGQLVGRLDAATGALQLRTDDSARRMDEASEKFVRHVQSTNKFFADHLGEAATHLDEKLESISLQLTGKLEATGTKLSERLEDVSILVEKSVDRFNSDIERVLHTREDVLGDLTAKLGKKAEDVDSMMRNYMVLIEESLNKAESRSREIGRVIAGQADTATQNLEQQIKQLESTSDAQIAAAARQLREQYERAVNTMNEMLSMTAGEFTQTAQDMRVTAQQVVRDIESARSELRQAILDLPEETRSNAAAMRKVVADQIEALNALAEVVKRQTTGLDLSGPGISILDRKEGSTGKSAGSAAETAHGRTGETSAKRGNNQEEAETGPTIRGRSVSALLETETPKGSSNLLPQLRTEDGGLPATRPRKKSDTGSVSRETEALVGKLNAAARDLVEAIDGKLPADLERRYIGGEQHVYTHRLYQGRGKKMLELLVDRYENERLIRAGIDGYVRLFERLLDTVSETPQGEQLVDACLASESGKLYLMLAQASGRLAT